MSLVKLLRHSMKGEDNQLTNQGREYARHAGELLAEEYPDHEVYAISSPAQRCVDTATLIAEGYKNKGGKAHYIRSDSRLAHSYTKNDIAKIMELETGLDDISEIIEVAPESSYKDAENAAQVCDELREGEEDILYIAVTHNTNVSLIAYYVSDGDEIVGMTPVSYIEGVTINDDTMTINYCGNMEVEYDRSIVEKVRNSKVNEDNEEETENESEE